jgi:D-glycero-D-manno-heptose 1,7-bisphosphate phosphatase
MDEPVAAERTVILDRDGTVIVDRHYLDDPEAMELLPGAADGLRGLYERGYKLVIITNQSGVGRGLFSLRRLQDIHDRLRAMIAAVGAELAGIYFCPHVPEDLCNCRKPRLGLLIRAAADLGFDPTNAVVVGDKLSDVEFGRRAGAATVLIAGNREDSYGAQTPDFVAPDLVSAAEAIDSLARRRVQRQRG